MASTDTSPVTKADLAALAASVTALSEKIDTFQSEVREHYATKTDLANLKADVLGQINRQTWAIVTLQIVALGVLVAILRLID